MRRAACLLWCLAAYGEQLPVRTYTTADGLAGNTIDRIVRDSRGYLWFCTREGISRFDGYRFLNFGAERGLPALDADLVETPSGDYFVATGDGIARFRPSDPVPHFTLIRLAEAQSRRFGVLAADPAGGLWAGSVAGLYHLDPPRPPVSHEWNLRAVDIGLPKQTLEDRLVKALLVDRAGTLWVGTQTGLYRRLPGGQASGTSTGPPIPNVMALAQDREGRLWAGWRQGVCRILPDRDPAGKRLEDICEAVPALAGEPAYFLHQAPDGRLWVGSSGLLQSWLPGTGAAARFTALNGLPGGGTGMIAAAEDSSGNLWVSGFGAIRIARTGLHTYLPQDGLDSAFIASLFEDRAGELCVVSEGPHGRMVNRFDGSRFQAVRPATPSPVRWGWATGQIALQARNGEWWIPTASGAFRFPPLADFLQLGRTPPAAAYESGNSVFAVFEDSRGGVWLSSQILSAPDGPTRSNALARWDPASGELRHFSDADGVPSKDLATAFAEDGSGAVWIALSSGSLLRYAAGRFRLLPPPLGRTTWIDALYLDRAGRVWIATRYGATVIDPAAGSPPVTYTTADGLSTNAVECIVEDLYGHIYLASGHGVDRISFAPGAPLRIRRYTTADGLARGEMRAAFRDHTGALWFGTREGLSRLEPEAEEPAVTPPVFISGLRVRGASRPVSGLGESTLDGIRLAPDQNQLEIEFVSLRFGAGETLRYQYRLGNRDADWSPPAEQRTVTYASLPPGNYRWQVRALTADGVPSERPATLVFTILPPLWQRWWLRLAAALAACALLYALYRYRLERLLEMERLRTRIATDLHDDIGSALSQIAILSEVAQRCPAAECGQPLEDIAGLSRELVDSMSDIVWAIDPEQDRLGDLSYRMRRFANDLFGHNGVRVRLQAPGAEHGSQLAADLRRQVFLIFKEGLHNMARHSACHEANIHLELRGGWLELSLSDDGVGFDPACVRRGHGLASMAQRAREIGGALAVDSAPGRGVAIRLRVPLGPRKAGFWKTNLHTWVGPLARVRRKLGFRPE